MNRTAIFVILCIAAAGGFAAWLAWSPPPEGQDAPVPDAAPVPGTLPDTDAPPPQQDPPARMEPAPFAASETGDASEPQTPVAAAADAGQSKNLLLDDKYIKIRSDLRQLLNMGPADIATLKPECVAQIIAEFDEIKIPCVAAAIHLFKVQREYHNQEIAAGRFTEEIPVMDYTSPMIKPDFPEQIITSSWHYCDVRKCRVKRFLRINPGDDERTDAARLAKEEADYIAGLKLRAIIDAWK